MQKILDIYRTFISHTEGLNAFYDGLRSQIAEVRGCSVVESVVV